MSNPAEHEARKDAERSGQVVGSDVDRIESALMAELFDCPAVSDEGRRVGEDRCHHCGLTLSGHDGWTDGWNPGPCSVCGERVCPACDMWHAKVDELERTQPAANVRIVRVGSTL